MKKVIKIEKSDQKIQNSKDVISIQELIQYKLQYKCFTRNQIRAVKRPPNFPSRKQRQNTMMSQYTYSSVNMTENQESPGAAFEIVPTVQSNDKGAPGQAKAQTPPCPYEIENSKQILVLTGSSHEELRIIVESFLQANVKIRTKYKCCVLHHCTEENPLSRDTYYMVKNIMRQILHTLPFLSQYLQI